MKGVILVTAMILKYFSLKIRIRHEMQAYLKFRISVSANYMKKGLAQTNSATLVSQSSRDLEKNIWIIHEFEMTKIAIKNRWRVEAICKSVKITKKYIN